MKNIIALIQETAERLLSLHASKETATQATWWLLEKVTGHSKAMLLAQKQINLSTEQQQKLDFFIIQRLEHKVPLQYLLETVPFCNVTIQVQSPILIPRPETEEWVTWLLALLKKIPNQPLNVLDLCTGTGCIGLALAANLPRAQVWAVDINPQAIALAKKNQQFNNVTNITFLTGDLFASLPANFSCDLIVSNPPYLSQQEYVDLSSSVKNFEDKQALVAKNNGLEFYTRILEKAPNLLTTSILNPYTLPNLVFEIGTAQANIEDQLKKYPIKQFHIHRDLQGRRRWVAVEI